MIVVSHESHDMYNPIFVLINLFLKHLNYPCTTVTANNGMKDFLCTI